MYFSFCRKTIDNFFSDRNNRKNRKSLGDALGVATIQMSTIRVGTVYYVDLNFVCVATGLPII